MRHAAAALIAVAISSLALPGQAMAEETACPAPAEVSADTPALEIAGAVRDCIGAGRHEAAMRLYFLYSAYALYDQQRAGPARSEALFRTIGRGIFEGWPAEDIAALQEAAAGLRDRDGAPFLTLCAEIATAGPPRYAADYLSALGLPQDPHPMDDGHVFDPEAAWDRALHEVNGCPRG